RRGTARERTGAEEAPPQAARKAGASLEGDLQQARQRLLRVTLHVAGLAEACQRARQELAQVEQQEQAQRQAVTGCEAGLVRTEERLVQLREQGEAEKDNHAESMRIAGRMHNDAVSYKAQLDNLARERERLQMRSSRAAQHLASLDVELQELTRADEQLQAKLQTARDGLGELQSWREELEALRDQTAQRAADVRAERSGLVSRVEVLQDLERSHEGLGTGVREVFAHLESAEPGPWRTVLGLVA